MAAIQEERHGGEALIGGGVAYGDERVVEAQSAGRAEDGIREVLECGDERGESENASASGVPRGTCFRCAYDREGSAVLGEVIVQKWVGVHLGHSALTSRAEGIRRGCFHFPVEEHHNASYHPLRTVDGNLGGSSWNCCRRAVSAYATAFGAGGAGARVARAPSAHARESSEYLYAADALCAFDARAGAASAFVAGPDRDDGEMGYPVEDAREGLTVHEGIAETNADPVESEESAVRDETALGGGNL